DGSFHRYEPPNLSVPPSEDRGIASKDVIVDSDSGLWVRMYLPLNAINADPQRSQRLPVCFYFHGGGFCIGSASWKEFHTLCISIASRCNGGGGVRQLQAGSRAPPPPPPYDDCSARHIMVPIIWRRRGRSMVTAPTPTCRKFF
ncbi:hypothetical protein KI387_027276, partial [Taxus chinensis]